MEKITHYEVGNFIAEIARKHKVEIDDLNLHISCNTLYVQIYTPNERVEFKQLEEFELIPNNQNEY